MPKAPSGPPVVSVCTSAAGTTYATVGDTPPPTIIAPPDVDIDL